MKNALNPGSNISKTVHYQFIKTAGFHMSNHALGFQDSCQKNDTQNSIKKADFTSFCG
jgi:hypothetical protein